MICKNCIHSEVCKHKTEAVYSCEHFKDGTIKNQYDRIRNMSVEKLVEFIHCITSSIAVKLNGGYVSNEIEYIKRYLESEVTE